MRTENGGGPVLGGKERLPAADPSCVSRDVLLHGLPLSVSTGSTIPLHEDHSTPGPGNHADGAGATFDRASTGAECPSLSGVSYYTGGCWDSAVANRGSRSGSCTVVADSRTGEFAGFSGQGEVAIGADGGHTLTLDSACPGQP